MHNLIISVRPTFQILGRKESLAPTKQRRNPEAAHSGFPTHSYACLYWPTAASSDSPFTLSKASLCVVGRIIAYLMSVLPSLFFYVRLPYLTYSSPTCYIAYLLLTLCLLSWYRCSAFFLRATKTRLMMSLRRDARYTTVEWYSLPHSTCRAAGVPPRQRSSPPELRTKHVTTSNTPQSRNKHFTLYQLKLCSHSDPSSCNMVP